MEQNQATSNLPATLEKSLSVVPTSAFQLDYHTVTVSGFNPKYLLKLCKTYNLTLGQIYDLIHISNENDSKLHMLARLIDDYDFNIELISEIAIARRGAEEKPNFRGDGTKIRRDFILGRRTQSFLSAKNASHAISALSFRPFLRYLTPY